MSPLKSLLSACIAIGVGLYLLWTTIAATHENLRLAANPHERALVENTWTGSGRHASRYADLSFANTNGGALCHVKGVRLGSGSVSAHIGQRIDIAPLPGSCDAPDVATELTPKWLLSAKFLLAFAAFAGGLLKLTGAPVPFARA